MFRATGSRSTLDPLKFAILATTAGEAVEVKVWLRTAVPVRLVFDAVPQPKGTNGMPLPLDELITVRLAPQQRVYIVNDDETTPAVIDLILHMPPFESCK